MSNIPIAPAYLLQLALALGIGIIVAFFLQGAVAIAVRLFFRIPLTLDEREADREVRELLRNDLDRIEVWYSVCSTVSLVSFPLLFLWAARAMILKGSAPPQVLIHTGTLVMAIPLMIAGGIAGSVFVKGIIQSRYSYPQSAALVDLFVRCDDHKYGYLGRLFRGRGGQIAAAIVILVAVLAGNRYSVITSSTIDIPVSLFGTGRSVIPVVEVVRLVESRRVKKDGRLSGPTYFVFLSSGEVLSSSSVFLEKPGVLADLGNSAKKAMPLLSRATGKPVEKIVLQPGQQLSDYDFNEVLEKRDSASDETGAPESAG